MPFRTLAPLLWIPVGAGLWKQHELWDGTYTAEDLVDVLEFLEIKDVNEKLYQEYVKLTQGG